MTLGDIIQRPAGDEAVRDSLQHLAAAMRIGTTSPAQAGALESRV
jgi:hypothetical protein